MVNYLNLIWNTESPSGLIYLYIYKFNYLKLYTHVLLLCNFKLINVDVVVVGYFYLHINQTWLFLSPKTNMPPLMTSKSHLTQKSRIHTSALKKKEIRSRF